MRPTLILSMLVGACFAVLFTLSPDMAGASLPSLSPEAFGNLVIAGVTLDIFRQNAFSVMALTETINKVPFVPGQAGRLAGFTESGITTLSVMIEEQGGTLNLINPTPRGGPGTTIAKDHRVMRMLSVPHIEINDAIYADEVQGIRAFGSETEVMTVQGLINTRLNQHVAWRLDPTLEYQRVGALRGIILNPDGSTLYNLFTEFGVTQQTEVAFDLSAASTGAVRAACAAVTRIIAQALGGLPFTGVHALASTAFFDDLIKNAEVRASYLQQAEASQLRAGYVYNTFNFGGITFEEYRGGVSTPVGATSTDENTTGLTGFVTADKAHFFPTGVPGLFRTVYAPADYIETVNTVGRPRYVKQYPMPNDKGINLDVQTNPLSYCTRPRVLVQGRRGA